jgi:hypothetical protein
MSVPPSEVGYTSTTTGRGDHEVHKGHVVAMTKEIILLCTFVGILFFSRGAAAQRGPWPPHSRGFLITRNDAPHSVGLLWTSDELFAETST